MSYCKMKIICSLESTKYSEKGEVESPERILDSFKFLKEKGFEFIEPEAADENDILRIHSKKLLEAVKTNGLRNKEFLDYDIVPYKNIFYYASLSAGAAIKAMELCFEEPTFSLMRPPGHHAAKIAEGFCFFNNIAIAVARALDKGKVKKAAILDIDLHQGNGTQNIFFNDERVLFVSFHQSPLYPGTGLISEKNCINYPLKAGSDEKIYLKKLREAIKKIEEFNPDMIAVSAGFDAFKEDPLGNLKLEIESYEKIAKLIKSIGKPVFSVLEGGYSKKLPECIYSYLKGFE